MMSTMKSTRTPPEDEIAERDPADDARAPRRSVQRDAVLAALRASSVFLSAQTLFERVQTRETPVALATVYRHLNAFVDAGIADTIWRSGHQLFRACNLTDVHHHLVCDSCGSNTDIHPPLGWLESATRAEGYTVEHVVLEVFGRCAGCTAST